MGRFSANPFFQFVTIRSYGPEMIAIEQICSAKLKLVKALQQEWLKVGFTRPKEFQLLL